MHYILKLANGIRFRAFLTLVAERRVGGDFSMRYVLFSGGGRDLRVSKLTEPSQTIGGTQRASGLPYVEPLLQGSACYSPDKGIYDYHRDSEEKTRQLMQIRWHTDPSLFYGGPYSDL